MSNEMRPALARSAWHADVRAVVPLSGHDRQVRAVACAADGRLGLSGGVDGTLRLWDLETATCLQVLRHHGQVTSVAITGDGAAAVSGGDNGTVLWWDLRTGASASIGTGDAELIASIDVSTDGRVAAFTDPHRGVFWVSELASGSSPREIDGCGIDPLSVALTSDGRHALVGGGRSGAVQYWDLVNEACIRTIDGHHDFVTAVAVSPDGRYALTASRSIRLWDLGTGACLRTLRGHETVEALAFTPDAGRAVSAGGDGTVRMWDLNTGMVARVLRLQTDPVWALAASRHLDVVLTAGIREPRCWTVAWRGPAAVSAQSRFPVGATLDDGTYLVTECLFGGPPPAIYRGVKTAGGGDVLITLAPMSDVSYAGFSEALALPIAGIGALRYIGPVDGRAGGDYAAMVEDEPHGVPLSRASLPMTPRLVGGLLRQLAQVAERARAAGHVLGCLQPDLTYVAQRGDDYRLTGLTPRPLAFLAALFRQAAERNAHPVTIRPLFDNYYLAPEVVRDPFGEHEACDVFSLCTIAAHLICGEHPFEGQGVSQAVSIGLAQRRPWSGPADWQSLLERGLAMEPRERPTVDELITQTL
jgi:hypothetical protein